MVTTEGFFCPPILCGWWIGDHPQEDLAKFWLQIREKSRIILKPHHILATWKNPWSKYLVISTFSFLGPQNMFTILGHFSPPKKPPLYKSRVGMVT
jgi:hypothetical protein